MKFKIVLFSIIFAFADSVTAQDKPAALATPTSATTTQLPSEFGGRWNTYDNAGTNVWKVEKVKDGAGVLQYWGSRGRPQCNSSNIPVSVGFDGTTIVITALKPMGCGDSFVITLRRVSNTDEFDGKIQTNFYRERPEYKILLTKITVK